MVVFDYDDNESCFYVSDRDNNNWNIHTPKGRISENFHKVSYKEMEDARNSSFRPFPAKNKWLKFDFSQAISINQISIRDAILKNTHSMLNPPAQLLGINGIRKFAKEIKKWKRFIPDKLKLAGITNYFMINADGGTGGGAFRNMYGDFLIESSAITNNADLTDYGNKFKQIGNLWDNIGIEMMNINKTCDDANIEKLPEMILNIADKEESELISLRNTIK